MRSLPILQQKPFYPTASELHRAAECQAPWALGLPESEAPAGEWAEMGRRLHWGAELLAQGQGMIDTLARVLPEPNGNGHEAIMKTLEHVEQAVVRDIEAAQLENTSKRLRDAAWLVEQGVAWRQTFALDGFGFPTVPRFEAKLIDREPGERLRGWFSGTADLAYMRADGVLLVADWKFGPSAQRLDEDAEDHAQLWTLALGLTTALGMAASTPDIVIARVEARYVSESGIVVDGYDLTGAQLQAWGETLATLAARIDSAANAKPKLSQACGRCKAKASCPTWEAFSLEIMSQMSDAAEALTRPPESPFDVSVLYHARKAAEHATGQWKEWEKAWLLLHPEGVPVGLGLDLRAKQRASRAVVKTPESMALIRSVAGDAALEMKESATLKTIESAVKEGAGVGITSKSDRDKAKRLAVENAFARLIEGGAIEEKGKTYAVGLFRSDRSEVSVERMEEE